MLFLRLRRTATSSFSLSHLRNATHRDARFRLSPPPRPVSRQKFRPFNHRQHQSIPPHFVFWGVISLNGIVYLMWSYAVSHYQTLGDPTSLIWMRQNFLVNLNNIREGRIWCLLTACFSHESTAHLLFNGFSYFFMAQPVLAILGNSSFLSLYLGAGVFASVTSLAWRTLRGGSPNDSSLGASAAIYAIVSYFACLQPRTTFYLFAVVPCPAWAWLAGIFAFDGYHAIAGTRQHIDSIGHIGGLLAGAAYFFFRRSPFRF